MVVDDLHRNTTAGQRWLPRLSQRRAARFSTRDKEQKRKTNVLFRS